MKVLQKRLLVLTWSISVLGITLLPIAPANAAACSPTATDYQSSNSTFRVLAFTSVGTCDWISPASISTVDQLVVAGGGGGGSAVGSGSAGGGGGGQVISLLTQSITPATTYSVVVGGGGTSPTSVVAGGLGGTSTFNGSSAAGGGGGATANANTSISQASAGYAGGGGAAQAAYVSNGATGSSGYKGGNGLANNSDANFQSGGGGAGANGAGGAGTTSLAGAGGNGVASSVMTGSAVYYGGGGGGGKRMSANGPGSGTHGGGNGGQAGTAGSAGTANRGGGGGGAGGPDGQTTRGGTGGSGLVGVRYTMMSGTPSFTGTSKVGAAVTADNSGLTFPGSVTPVYQWQVASTSNGTYSDIAGATNSSYVIASADRTKFLRLKVFAQDSYGISSTSFLSVASSAVDSGTPSITLSIAAGQTVYRTSKSISVSTNSLPGKVKFLANGKAIPGCISSRSNAGNSFQASCAWKPSNRGNVGISAIFKPDDVAYSQGSASPQYVFVTKRSINRS